MRNSWICILLLLCAVPYKGSAQDTNKQSDAEKDTLVYDFLILGAKSNNQFTFLGRDFGQNTPMISANAMYYFHSGLWLNVSSFHFFNDQIPMQSAVTAGYLKALSDRVEFNLSYSQFFASGESGNIGVRNQGMAQASIGLDWGLLYSTLQPQVLLNESPDIFVASQHSRYFEFNTKLWKVFTVSFEPQVTLMMGTGNYYYLDVEGEVEGDDPSRFKWQSGEVEFPVEFEAGSWSFKVFAKYVHPFNVPEWDPSRPRMVYGAGMNYFVPIKRKKRQ